MMTIIFGEQLVSEPNLNMISIMWHSYWLLMQFH